MLALGVAMDTRMARTVFDSNVYYLMYHDLIYPYDGLRGLVMIVSLWVLVVAYAAHVIEEHALNWKDWASSISGISLQWSEFYIANFAVIILGIACASVGEVQPWFSYLFPGLAVINALVAHIGAAVVTKKYSPGLLTSIFLFLPIGGWAYYDAFILGFLTVPFILFTVIGGLLIMGFPVLIQLLKKRMIKRTE